jgi:hypothetical protein
VNAVDILATEVASSYFLRKPYKDCQRFLLS